MATLALQPTASHAQVAPSQVTPPTLRPPPPSVGLPSAPSGAPVQAPPGSDQISFIVGRVQIDGGFPELAEETAKLVRDVEGKRLSVAQVYQFASSLEQAYARAGYIFVRVTVPNQKLVDHGTLRIEVVDGYIERVDSDRVPETVRSVVTARVQGLVNRRHIKLAEIERYLLNAGDVPGLRLKSALARGQQPGGVLLVLEGDYHVVTGAATIDDRLPNSLGTWSYGGSLAVNTPFGLGEQLYVSAQSAGSLTTTFEPTSPLRVLGVGLLIPLGKDSWTLNPEYTYSRSVPKPVDGGLDNIGRFERVAIRSSYSFIRTRSQTFSLTAGYESITQTIELPDFDTYLNRDRYSVARLTGFYEGALPFWGMALQATGTYSRGLGGRDQSDALQSGIPLSRLGAGPVFNKANVDLRLIQPLPEGLRADFYGRFQSSFKQPLLVSEQFSLDGPLAISSYPNGSFSVDEGATVRGELSKPFAVTELGLPLTLSPYVFGAYGVGRLNEPTFLEEARIRAGAFGAGIRGAIDLPNGYNGMSMGLEGARQYTDTPDLRQGWRINLNVALRY